MRLNRIWQAIETTDIEMSDASERIRERRVTPDNAELRTGMLLSIIRQ